MSVIQGLRPLATGMDSATNAIRRAQDRLAVGAAEVARQGAAKSDNASPAKATSTRELLPAQTPPNPGPPGGAQPADLAQAMVAQRVATHEVAADVKTVQAFDQILNDLTRLKAPQPAT